MTTEPKKVPTDTVLEGEVLPPAEAKQDPKERSGAFARLTTDKDVEKVNNTFNTMRPYLKVAGRTALLLAAPETATAMALSEGIQAGARYLQKRRLNKEIIQAVTTAQ